MASNFSCAKTFTVPTHTLATQIVIYQALGKARKRFVLDLNGIRDLLANQHKHIKLDFARLIATIILLVFAIIIGIIQSVSPNTGIGNIGIFYTQCGFVGRNDYVYDDVFVCAYGK
jgi:hypothetical protein